MYLADLVIGDRTHPELSWTCTDQDSVQPVKVGDRLRPGTLPWDYQDESINVALTGKAFKYALDRQIAQPFVFNSILAKARVFARMSPDDKALLVDSL